jgi:multiple sugar transport system substrate-binding protein
MRKLTRRGFAGTVAGTALGSVALGALSPQALAETRLRFFWWGNPERNKRTYEVVELFKQKNPEVAVDPETIGWDDYWPKMATQASGRNMADVIQMDYRFLFEYARRNQLEPLDEYMGNGLDLSAFNPGFLDSGKVDGKLYAVPWTSNSTTCYYDSAKMAELGIAMPDHTWTWDDLKRIAGEVKKAGLTDYWGVSDKGRWEPMMEFFMRQRGKALYNEDGGLGFEEADVADYFGLWESFRKEGLATPGDLTAQDNTLQTMPLTLGKSAIDFAHSNQIVALQSLNKNELQMTMLPNLSGGEPGQYLKPSMLVSVARTSPAKPEAVAFTQFLVADWDAAQVLRVERGVPGDEKIRDRLIEVVNPVEKKMLEYLAVVSNNVGPLPPAPPKGAGEVDKMLLRTYPEMAFGRISVKDGAAQFYRDAELILRRA